MKGSYEGKLRGEVMGGQMSLHRKYWLIITPHYNSLL